MEKYKITVDYHLAFGKVPIWAKGITAGFGGFGGTMSREEAENILASLSHYLREYTYIRRNSTERLTMHPMTVTRDAITVCSVTGNPVVTFKIEKA